MDGLISKSSQDKGFQWTGVAVSISSNSPALSSSNQSPYQSGSSDEIMSISASGKSELNGFIESIQNFPELPAVVNIEKTQILAIIDLLSEVSTTYSSSAYQSLDEPGRRFWVALKFQQLHFLQKSTRAASLEDLLMEKLARAQYLRNKNPRDYALLYIALNQIQVLAGLFKISKDEKDKPLFGFLLRNFQDEKNKASALKIAYVLLGKHQLELAIAFFMLGGDQSSAINICAKNLGDEQLAIVIYRLVEGHGGPL